MCVCVYMYVSVLNNICVYTWFLMYIYVYLYMYANTRNTETHTHHQSICIYINVWIYAQIYAYNFFLKKWRFFFKKKRQNRHYKLSIKEPYFSNCAEQRWIVSVSYPLVVLQCGEDSWDALSCGSFLAKEPLIVGLFCGKWPMKIKHPVTLCHPVFMQGSFCKCALLTAFKNGVAHAIYISIYIYITAHIDVYIHKIMYTCFVYTYVGLQVRLYV